MFLITQVQVFIPQRKDFGRLKPYHRNALPGVSSQSGDVLVEPTLRMLQHSFRDLWPP